MQLITSILASVFYRYLVKQNDNNLEKHKFIN